MKVRIAIFSEAVGGLNRRLKEQGLGRTYVLALVLFFLSLVLGFMLAHPILSSFLYPLF